MFSTKKASNSAFDVAIVGGGIAGLSLAIGLATQSVPVTIYEAANSFGEIGAGVFFHPNAIRAMEGIDPRILQGFEKVGNANGNPNLHNVCFDFRYGDGDKAGELFYRQKTPGRHGGCQRAKFLDELIKLVPQGVAQFGKRLTSMEKTAEKILLKFKDGTEARHDCVIGCDGVHSEIRKYILGADDPAATAVFSGKYCHRGLAPMDKVIENIGEELATNSQFYVGHGSHLLTFPVNGGKTFNAVAMSSCETWDYEKWVVPPDVKDIKQDFSTFGGPVQKIIQKMESTDIWALFDHLPARTFVQGKVAMCGDAAHATTPHQGSGAGFAIEDAYILSSLLGHVQQPGQIEACLTAYDAVRRERGLKLVKTSREAGEAWELEYPEAGDEIKNAVEAASSRMDWIWNEDLEAEIQHGLKLMGV